MDVGTAGAFCGARSLRLELPNMELVASHVLQGGLSVLAMTSGGSARLDDIKTMLYFHQTEARLATD